MHLHYYKMCNYIYNTQNTKLLALSKLTCTIAYIDFVVQYTIM